MTREEGRSTRHSFSFGPHYDQDNVGFGPLLCHDDHLLKPGAGFPDHGHRDLEIVTWVLTGMVEHTEEGQETVRLGPGAVAVQSAGTGIRHGEVAAQDAGPTRFVQAWLTPDEDDVEPSYDVRRPTIHTGELTPVAGAGTSLAIGTEGATLSVARLEAGQHVTLPGAPLQHVFVANGSLGRSSLAEPLQAGDAFRITDDPGLTVTAASPTELLVWTFTR
ncbi:pirin family protein [Nocardioides sp. GCM10027113]|uniref:pirin family protein n=1 Tax=unclassified Nocardioides TaxID=2615069 RepID=UPI00360ECD30